MKYAVFVLLLSACTELQTSDVQSNLEIGENVNIALSAGDNDDLNTSSCSYSHSICNLIGDAGGSVLTGINGPGGLSYGSSLFLRNRGSVPITIRHNDSGSTAGKRFLLPNSTDIVITPGRHLQVYLSYDYVNSPAQTEGWHVLVDRAIYGVESVSTPSRSIGTAFQNTSNRPLVGTYSVSASCEITLLGGEAGYVEFRSDSSNPPTTVRARVAECANTGTVVVGVAVNVTAGGSVTYMIRPGDYGVLASVNTTGTPAYAVTAQAEQVW